MSNFDETRWKQRLENLGKALKQLETACEKDSYSDLERAGLVQIFEFTFELGWKTFKDLLFFEGYDEKTPRNVVRRAFEVAYLNEEDAEIWLDALGKRNLLTHTYEEEIAEEAVSLIKNNYCPALKRAYRALVEKRKE